MREKNRDHMHIISPGHTATNALDCSVDGRSRVASTLLNMRVYPFGMWWSMWSQYYHERIAVMVVVAVVIVAAVVVDVWLFFFHTLRLRLCVRVCLLTRWRWIAHLHTKPTQTMDSTHKPNVSKHTIALSMPVKMFTQIFSFYFSKFGYHSRAQMIRWILCLCLYLYRRSM